VGCLGIGGVRDFIIILAAFAVTGRGHSVGSFRCSPAFPAAALRRVRDCCKRLLSKGLANPSSSADSAAENAACSEVVAGGEIRRFRPGRPHVAPPRQPRNANRLLGATVEPMEAAAPFFLAFAARWKSAQAEEWACYIDQRIASHLMEARL
jgi:hypothetical protein